ncbi:MAG: hypothetical protein HND48_12525 [Chloroflexi bacterium]|nr:hypothetical protein [Chloroflexota bacterium]
MNSPMVLPRAAEQARDNDRVLAVDRKLVTEDAGVTGGLREVIILDQNRAVRADERQHKVEVGRIVGLFRNNADYLAGRAIKREAVFWRAVRDRVIQR